MSYPEFQKYIDKEYTKKHVNFERDIAPQIKKLTTDAFRAVWSKIDPHRRVNSFECYGFDFMLDEDFKVFLIEVNNNPSLSTQSSSHLSMLIPSML